MLREEVLVAVPRADTAGGLSGIMSQLSDEDFQRIQVGRQEDRKTGSVQEEV